MSDTSYTGVGSTPQEAYRDAQQVAEKNDVKGTLSKTEYVVKINGVVGEVNPDYNAALRSAAQEAKIDPQNLTGVSLEIKAYNFYVESKPEEIKPRPRAGGSAPVGRRTESITDLF
ncbi:MAG TPA: hypothetical protein VJC39_04975 [Candidatus Nanoarchaeia archaeon]|nr:hypothetical protein [Candidatus Nanoarchaeia archaeon]